MFRVRLKFYDIKKLKSKQLDKYDFKSFVKIEQFNRYLNSFYPKTNLSC